MKIVTSSVSEWPELNAPHVTLGTFDGVHLGHQRLIDELTTWAEKEGAPSVAITFDRPPRETLDQARPEHVTSLRHRLLLLERLGLDVAIVLRFDAALAKMEAGRFIREIIVRRLNAAGVLLGHDTRFGRGGRGDAALFQRLADELGFAVRSVPVVMLDGAPVSSTRVRQAVRTGNLAQARRLLGRPWSTLGTVVHGTGRGKGFGYPTANLDLHHEVQLPEGVYATRTGFAGRWHDSVTNIGRAPSFRRKTPHLSEEVVTECFLLGFDGDLYGREVEVRFLELLRKERVFDGPEELARQIASDVEAAGRVHRTDTNEPEPIV